MSMSRRDAADLDLSKRINFAFYEFRGIVTRIKRGGFPSEADVEVIENVERLLEEAAGRLVLRQPETPE